MFFSLFLVFIDIFSAIVLRASIYKSNLILSKINFFIRKMIQIMYICQKPKEI